MSSFGEYRVDRQFNPNNNEEIDEVKEAAAHFIDTVQNNAGQHPEAARLAALAMTYMEIASMLGVKACVKQPR